MAYLLLCRAWNALFAAGVCVYSFVIIKKDFTLDYFSVISLSLAVFFLVAFANAHNDITDYEIDKINKPGRVLTSNKINFKKAKIATVLCFLFSIILGFVVNIKFVLLFIIVNVLSFVYNKYLKQLPLVGNFTVALLTTTPIVIPIIFFDSLEKKLLSLILFAFMLTFVREITKDIEDIKGDRELGLKTFPILFGTSSSLILIILCELQLLLYIIQFNIFLFAIIAPCLIISLIFALIKKWQLSQVAVKITMFVGLLFFIRL